MHITIIQTLEKKIKDTLDSLFTKNYLISNVKKVEIIRSKEPTHGDFASPIALSLARIEKKNPNEIAIKIKEYIFDDPIFEKIEIAGPGYLNFFIKKRVWKKALEKILIAKENYILSDKGNNKKILIDFVSANPTGPLHFGHGRGAVIGDVIANLLSAVGFHVEREYYVNDLGRQVDVLAHSVYFRYLELNGQNPSPLKDFYPDDYIKDIAQDMFLKYKDIYVNSTESDWISIFRIYAIQFVLKLIRSDLERFGIHFDRFFSEKELIKNTNLDDFILKLEKKDYVYNKEGKKWFVSTQFGDDKDRVLLREDGTPTYFATDMLYHHNKLTRGFDKIINIFGADHSGYCARIQAGIRANGFDNDPLDIVIVQMVRLVSDGKSVRMGKRLGNSLWLKDIMDMVGVDAARYFFAMRRSSTQFDFNLTLATQKSLDNPVYYAQMGYARLCAITKKAKETGILLPELKKNSLDALNLPEEIEIIKKIEQAPDLIILAAKDYEPHLIVHYIQDLVSSFHSYYTIYKHSERVISTDIKKTEARLLLCEALKHVLKSLLNILGVDSPKEMSLLEKQ